MTDANHAYLMGRRAPHSIAMALANGIEIESDGGGYKGALVGSDDLNRSVVEWTCPHSHPTKEEAHECSRQAWFTHHG